MLSESIGDARVFLDDVCCIGPFFRDPSQLLPRVDFIQDGKCDLREQ